MGKNGRAPGPGTYHPTMPTRYDQPPTLADRQARRQRLADAADLARQDPAARAELRATIDAIDRHQRLLSGTTT